MSGRHTSLIVQLRDEPRRKERLSIKRCRSCSPTPSADVDFCLDGFVFGGTALGGGVLEVLDEHQADAAGQRAGGDGGDAEA
jgi:hypothetical protein